MPPRADSIVVDSTKVRDTLPAVPMPVDSAGDTLRVPLARSESPVLVGIGVPYRWDRADLFASGAVTLLELLQRIPGVTPIRAGWIGYPEHAAVLGQTDRVRVFLDGLEIDPLDARTGRSLDLSQVQLWTLEEVAVERDADELRVWLRSWSVNSTNPYTRTDVYTGDEETNVYRGFFGRRYKNGWALQVGGQQLSTQNDRLGRSADNLDLFTRVGWAKGNLRADGFVDRSGRTRVAYTRHTRGSTEEFPPLAPLDASNTTAYLRAGWNQPGDAAWAQVIAGSLAFTEKSERTDSTRTTATPLQLPVDRADTATSRAEYVASAGVRRFGLAVTATARVRAYRGSVYASPSARVAFDRQRLALALFAEQDATGGTRRTSATARLDPLSFVSLVASAARREAIDPLPLDSLRSRIGLGPGGFVAASALRRAQPTQTSLRAEAGVRWRELWASGGLMTRDTALLATPTDVDPGFRYDTLDFQPISAGRMTATFVGLRGRFWKDVYADAWGARWSGASDTTRWFSPEWQSRATLGVRTNWLSRFPSGDFGFQFAVTHEYRSELLFPSSRGTLTARPQHSVSTLLELRIQTAVITWQYRNILGDFYEQAPGFEPPRLLNLYGVRWEFWN